MGSVCTSAAMLVSICISSSVDGLVYTQLTSVRGGCQPSLACLSSLLYSLTVLRMMDWYGVTFGVQVQVTDPPTMNVLQALVGGLAAFMAYSVVGIVWYSSLMFEKPFMEMQFHGKKPSKSMDFSMSLMPVNAGIKVLLLAAMYNVVGVTDFGGALLLAVLLAGCIICHEFDGYLFSDNPLGLFLIHAGHVAVSYTAATAVLHAVMVAGK